MISLLRRKADKLRGQLSDSLLEFKPYIKPLAIEGCPLRFFYGTPQAADWYDPLKLHNRRELEWLAGRVAGQKHKIVDAGAYHGLYTLVLAKAAGAGSEVVAIDPVPSNCALIEVNLLLNGLHATIEQCAISAVDGQVNLSSGSCARIVESGGTIRPSRRLPSIMPDATIVKLDIEGAEFSVLPGAIDELSCVQIWSVEIHPGAGKDPQTLLTLFEDRGFELWWLDRSGGGIARYPATMPWSERTSLIALRP